MPLPFVKQLGLDFIITPRDEILLIELQSGFGRMGPRLLFPVMWNRYRSFFRQCAAPCEPNPAFLNRIKRICRDKVKTFRHFKDVQPRSFHFRDWNSSALHRWIQACTSPYILAKPPMGSCGEGIVLLTKEQLQQDRASLDLGTARLLQEYVFSKSFAVDGDPHGRRIGCIRHIIMMQYDGEQLNIMHLPSYWRVAPAPFSEHIDETSLTANMSRGATAVQATDSDTALIRRASRRIAQRLVALSLQRDVIALGRESTMDSHGVIEPLSPPRRASGF